MVKTTPVLFPPFLVATDGSPSAEAAQKLVYLIAERLSIDTAELSTAAQPKIVVLTVQPRRLNRERWRQLSSGGQPAAKVAETSQSAPPESAVPTAGIPEALPQPQKDIVTSLNVAYQVRQGRPSSEILTCARTLSAGLIGVGSRGVGGVQELLLGNVSAVIARYAPCSVLIARADRDQQTHGLDHVLLLVSTVEQTKRAIALLHQLIPAGINQVTLLCVQPPINAGYLFGPFTTPNPSWQLNQSLQAAQKEQGERLLDQAKASSDLANLAIQSYLQVGEAGSAICDLAQQQQVDLILLASEGRRQSLLRPLQNLRHAKPNGRPLRNTRLNSTEDYVIHHAPCPVLLYRSTQTEN